MLCFLWVNASPIDNESGLDAVPVGLRHPVYRFLQRLESKGIVTFSASTRPLTRGDIVQCLRTAYQFADDFPDGDRMTRIDRLDLKRYIHEFQAVVEETIGTENRWEKYSSNISRLRGKIWPSAPLYRDGINLLTYKLGDISIQFNPVLNYNFVSDSTGETIIRRASGIHLTGSLASNWGYYFDFRDNLEKGRGPYFPSDREKLYHDNVGYVTMTGEDVAYYELTQVALSYSRSNLLLLFGRIQPAFGPGRRGNLILSDNAPPFDCVFARYDIGKYARFSYTTGVLHPYPEIYRVDSTTAEGYQRRILENKYIAAHRLEIYPLKGVEIGISETVIYGQRGLEPAYLIPLNLFYSAEHNLGDMDNVGWGADIELNLLRNVTLYGELFIDDMKTGKIGTDYYGNKFAYIGGLYLPDPLGIPDMEIFAEYARIDPFVYTHWYDINVYKNWNSCLGHYLPPNSEQLFIEARWRPFHTLTAGISGAFTCHGANPDSLDNVGGDIDLPPSIGGSTIAPFLAGDRIDITTWEAGLIWEPLEYYTITGKYRYHRWTGGDQWEWEINVGVSVW